MDGLLSLLFEITKDHQRSKNLRSQGPNILPTIDPWVSHHPQTSLFSSHPGSDQVSDKDHVFGKNATPVFLPQPPINVPCLDRTSYHRTQLVQWSQLKKRTHQQNPREVYMGDMASSENSIAINPLLSHHVPN